MLPIYECDYHIAENSCSAWPFYLGGYVFDPLLTSCDGFRCKEGDYKMLPLPIRAKKKPIIIQAIKTEDLRFKTDAINHKDFKLSTFECYNVLDKNNNPVIFMIREQDKPLKAKVVVQTLEGWMFCKEDDYIIRGVQDELYPCKKDIFEATYDIVEE